MSSLTCFPFATTYGAVASLFVPVLILRTPATEVVTVAATFDMVATEDAMVFGGPLVPGTTLAFDAD
jgi:hypothetical protein